MYSTADVKNEVQLGYQGAGGAQRSPGITTVPLDKMAVSKGGGSVVNPTEFFPFHKPLPPSQGSSSKYSGITNPTKTSSVEVTEVYLTQAFGFQKWCVSQRPH